MSDEREFSLSITKNGSGAPKKKKSLAERAQEDRKTKDARPKLASSRRKKVSRSNYVDRSDEIEANAKNNTTSVTENLGSKLQTILFFAVIGVIGWFVYPVVKLFLDK